MKNETLWFRAAVCLLAIVGTAVLVLSLHGRHPLPRDNAALPSVVGSTPQTPVR